MVKRHGFVVPMRLIFWEGKMDDLWTLLIVVAVWFFIQWWLLPKLGITT